MTAPALGARVARHTALSFAGFAVPLAVALIAIPITVRALGPARFGLLGLAWADGDGCPLSLACLGHGDWRAVTLGGGAGGGSG